MFTAVALFLFYLPTEGRMSGRNRCALRVISHDCARARGVHEAPPREKRLPQPSDWGVRRAIEICVCCSRTSSSRSYCSRASSLLCLLAASLLFLARPTVAVIFFNANQSMFSPALSAVSFASFEPLNRPLGCYITLPEQRCGRAYCSFRTFFES